MNKQGTVDDFVIANSEYLLVDCDIDNGYCPQVSGATTTLMEEIQEKINCNNRTAEFLKSQLLSRKEDQARIWARLAETSVKSSAQALRVPAGEESTIELINQYKDADPDALQEIKDDAAQIFPDYKPDEDENYPPELRCSISHEPLMRPVVVTASGQTYEEDQIKKWLDVRMVDPMTQVDLGTDKTKVYQRNYALQCALEMFNTERQREVENQRARFVVERLHEWRETLRQSEIDSQRNSLEAQRFENHEAQNLLQKDLSSCMECARQLRKQYADLIRCPCCCSPYGLLRRRHRCARCEKDVCATCCAYAGRPSKLPMGWFFTPWSQICVKCFFVNSRRHATSGGIPLFDDDTLPSYDVKANASDGSFALQWFFVKSRFAQFFERISS